MKSKGFSLCIIIVFAVVVLTPLLAFGKKGIDEPLVIKSTEKVTLSTGTLVYWQDIAEPVDLDNGSKALTGGMGFPGMPVSANGLGWPPDVNGDVGKTNVGIPAKGYYIQTVDASIVIYNKATGGVVSTATFNSFFPASVGAPCDYSNNGDPLVLYDCNNDRWFILGFSSSASCTAPFYFSIAASKTNDPTGAWWTYCMLADKVNVNDYPKCGIWNNAVWITANMWANCDTFQHAKIWAVKIPDLYSGTLTYYSIIPNSTQAVSLLPSHSRCPNDIPTGTPNLMFAMDASELGSDSIDALYMWKAYVIWDSYLGLTAPQEIPIAADLTADRASQPRTRNTLDSLYNRLVYPANYPANYKNYGTYESVILNHVCDDGSSRAVRWYEVRIDDTDTASIFLQGTYAPDSNRRWMDGMAQNKKVDIGSVQTPKVAAKGRCPIDHNTLPQSRITFISGTRGQKAHTGWDRYLSTFIDPDNCKTSQNTVEYSTSPGTSGLPRICSRGESVSIDSRAIGLGSAAGCTSCHLPCLPEVLDNSAIYSFVTQGDALWSCHYTASACDSVDWAKSGLISDNQTTCLEFSYEFGTNNQLSFDWSVSSEANYDYLRFYIDNVEQSSISGNVPCTTQTIIPTSGTHVIKWCYTKDNSKSGGADAGWVDNVKIVDCSICH